MNYICVITGISGVEQFLGDEEEVSNQREAKRFRSEVAALTAVNQHIHSFPSCIARQLKARVEGLREKEVA